MIFRDMTLRTLCFGIALLAMPVVAQAQTASFAVQADQIVNRFTTPAGPSASVAVYRDGKLIYQRARGESSIELHVPAKAESIYRIGSITKTVTAATVLTLVHDGKLALADPLSKFLPDYPGASSITIAQLLSHTAGVSDEWNADPTQPLDTKTLVSLIAKQPLDFKPGSEWRYSNSGYMLLGAVIEKVSGKPWFEAEHDLVLAPFGMTHTAYYADDAVVEGAVRGYSADASGKVTQPAFVSISGPMAAGALASTADDIAKLAEGLGNARVFPADLLKAMTTPATLTDGSTAPYGYGLMLSTVRGEPAYGHNGGIEGFSSQFFVIPKAHVAVAVLVNSGVGTPSARAIALQLAAATLGKPYRTFVDEKLSDTAMRALVGTYRIQGDSVHTITLDGGQLYIQRAPGPKRRLATAKGDVLYYVGEATDYIHVGKDKAGKVSALEFYSDGMAPARVEPRCCEDKATQQR
jgi:CubicO group peptidase (beta-lactamase class C family)